MNLLVTGCVYSYAQHSEQTVLINTLSDGVYRKRHGSMILLGAAVWCLAAILAAYLFLEVIVLL